MGAYPAIPVSAVYVSDLLAPVLSVGLRSEEIIMAVRTFAFIVDGDVIGTLHFSEDDPRATQWIAGFASDPIVREVPEGLSVRGGWTYDGKSFSEPKE